MTDSVINMITITFSTAPAGFTGFGTSLGFGAPATTSSSAFSFNTGFGQNAAAPSFGGFGTSLGGGS